MQRMSLNHLPKLVTFMVHELGVDYVN